MLTAGAVPCEYIHANYSAFGGIIQFFYFKFRHYDSESCLFRFFVHFPAAAMHSTIIAYYCRDSAVRHVNIRSSLRLSAHQLNCGSHAGRIRLARLTNSITDRPVYRWLTAMVRLSRLVGYDCNFECAQRRHAHCAGGCLQFTFTFASKWMEINQLRKSDVQCNNFGQNIARSIR